MPNSKSTSKAKVEPTVQITLTIPAKQGLDNQATFAIKQGSRGHIGTFQYTTEQDLGAAIVKAIAHLNRPVPAAPKASSVPATTPTPAAAQNEATTSEVEAAQEVVQAEAVQGDDETPATEPEGQAQPAAETATA